MEKTQRRVLKNGKLCKINKRSRSIDNVKATKWWKIIHFSTSRREKLLVWGENQYRSSGCTIWSVQQNKNHAPTWKLSVPLIFYKLCFKSLDNCVSVSQFIPLKLENVLHTKKNCCSLNDDDENAARDWISCHNVSESHCCVLIPPPSIVCITTQSLLLSPEKKNMEGMSWCVCFAHIFFSFSLFRHFLLC